MLTRRFLVGGAAAAAGLIWSNIGRAASRAALPPRHPALARLVETYMAERRIAGSALAIGRDNRRADFMAWGYSALSRGQFLNEDSLFRIYSMTKPVTGAAAMLLIEDGRLKLDQPIADFLPAFARQRVAIDPAMGLDSRPARRPITVRHLMTHTAGLSYAIMGNGPVERAYRQLGIVPSQQSLASKEERSPSLSAFAERLATVPLIAEPGTRWHYSVGLDLLGAVIELAAGVPFEVFLKERIFEPLDMDDTGFRVPRRSLARLVANYVVTAGGLQPLDMPPETVYALQPPFPYGGSGLVSSARDYSRFTAMLLGEGMFMGRQVMKPETVRTMMSNLLPGGVLGPDDQGFGAGGQVLIKPSRTGQGLGTYSWAGVGGTMMWVDPTYRVHATWLAQYMPIDALPVQLEVPRAVYLDLSRQS